MALQMQPEQAAAALTFHFNQMPCCWHLSAYLTMSSSAQSLLSANAGKLPPPLLSAHVLSPFITYQHVPARQRPP
jgi:hypothetical protein